MFFRPERALKWELFCRNQLFFSYFCLRLTAMARIPNKGKKMNFTHECDIYHLVTARFNEWIKPKTPIPSIIFSKHHIGNNYCPHSAINCFDPSKYINFIWTSSSHSNIKYHLIYSLYAFSETLNSI